jgi:hypothetical protein
VIDARHRGHRVAFLSDASASDEQCVTMACASKVDSDKALWLTMAQSWVRLADEVERSEMAHVLVSRRRRH